MNKKAISVMLLVMLGTSSMFAGATLIVDPSSSGLVAALYDGETDASGSQGGFSDLQANSLIGQPSAGSLSVGGAKIGWEVGPRYVSADAFVVSDMTNARDPFGRSLGDAYLDLWFEIDEDYQVDLQLVGAVHSSTFSAGSYVIGPGQYYLGIHIDTTAAIYSGYSDPFQSGSFDLRLQPVPVPGAFLLLALGLVSARLFRRA